MHAYLILAHNETELLKLLVKNLDFEKNDIFIHYDKKSKPINQNEFFSIVKKSNLYFVENPLNVQWGGFSQIKSEIKLMEEAHSRQKYKYYHLISGVDFPIWKNSDIYNYFNNSNCNEFISFDTTHEQMDSTINRMKYYYFFQDYIGRDYPLLGKLQTLTIYIQKFLGINRLKKFPSNFEIRKGMNWYSITNNLVEYILENKKLVYSLFRYTLCCDELFIQTIAWNSTFKDHITNNTMRFIDWDRGSPYTFDLNDYDAIINSNKIFARKFSKENLMSY